MSKFGDQKMINGLPRTLFNERQRSLQTSKGVDGVYLRQETDQYRAVVGVELQHLVYMPPGGEDFSDLARFLRRLAPKGKFSLRYVVLKPGKLQIALLIRLEGTEETELQGEAQRTLDKLRRYLQVNFKGYEFQPLSQPESYLDPFPVGDIVEISRQTAAITIASWKADYQPPLGVVSTIPSERAPCQDSEERENLFYVLPWLNKASSLRQLCETLTLQSEPCLIDFRLSPCEPAPEILETYEKDMHLCEKYLQGGKAEREGSVSALRTKMMLSWFFTQKHLMEAPGNVFMLRIWLAAEKQVPTDLIAALGNALTLPVQASATSAPYLAGGFQVCSYTPEAVVGGLVYLDEDIPISDSARYLFDCESVGTALMLPTSDAPTFPGIPIRVARFLDAPSEYQTSGTIIGQAVAQNQPVEVRLMPDDQRRHVYAIGQTGTGKTTLILKMAMDNIRKGDGVAVLDPHGDLIEQLLIRIPRERLDDVILFDPGDTEYPIGLNLLEWETEEQKAFLVDEMVAMLQLLYQRDEMGPIFWHNVRYGMLLLMARQGDPGTLVEFPLLFSNPDFHKRWLPYVKDPLVRMFWEVEFPKMNYYHDHYLHYIISKFDPFITPPLMRHCIGQGKSGFSFEAAINSNKILLVNLAKGNLGEGNSALLGMIVIAKLYAAAMRRVRLPMDERRDFYIYVDEFQNLATDNFAHILSEARKFRLNLMLCNQYIEQIPDSIAQAILGNVGSLIVFRTGLPDAQKLKAYFEPHIPKEALTDQPNYHAYARLMVEGVLTSPFSMWTLLEPSPQAEHQRYVREKVVSRSRKRYGKKRSQVEKDIYRSLLGKDNEE